MFKTLLTLTVIPRLREPSTWAGLAGLLAASHFAGASTAAEIVPVLGTALASAAAIILREAK